MGDGPAQDAPGAVEVSEISGPERALEQPPIAEQPRQSSPQPLMAVSVPPEVSKVCF